MLFFAVKNVNFGKTGKGKGNLMVVVLVICVLVGIILYYLLSPKKRHEREEQKKKETIHQKSISWKAHPIFPQIVDSCEKEMERIIEWAKSERVRQDGYVRGDTGSIHWWYGNELQVGITSVFQLDRNEYLDLTSEQSDALIEAIYQELAAKYHAEKKLKLNLQYGSDFHGYSIFFDVSEFHPRKELKRIDI